MELTKYGRAKSLFEFVKSVGSFDKANVMLGGINSAWPGDVAGIFDPAGMLSDAIQLSTKVSTGLTVTKKIVKPSALGSITYNGAKFEDCGDLTGTESTDIALCTTNDSYLLYVKLDFTNTDPTYTFRQIGFTTKTDTSANAKASVSTYANLPQTPVPQGSAAVTALSIAMIFAF